MPKLSVREAIAGLPDGAIGIVALSTETAASLFTTGTYRRLHASPHRPHLGRGRPLRLISAPKPTATNAAISSIPIAWRACCALLAHRRRTSPPSTRSMSISATTRGLRREAEEARRDGFTAKMAIHPAQVAIINEVFTPNAEAITHAKSILAAFEASQARASSVSAANQYGPHLVRAQRLLAAAAAKTSAARTAPERLQQGRCCCASG